MTNVQSEKQHVYAQVVEKAWESSEFKEKLIANPVQTIEELTGGKITIKNGKNLVVLEEADTLNRQPKEDETYLIIPENNQVNSELTEEELESVAGGLTIVVKFDKHGHFDGIDIDLTLF